jgi:hypothetical protein
MRSKRFLILDLNAAGGRFIFVHSFYPHERVILFESDPNDGTYSIPYQIPWPRTPVFITTNGNWFGALGGGFINTCQLASNGMFFNITEYVYKRIQSYDWRLV